MRLAGLCVGIRDEIRRTVVVTKVAVSELCADVTQQVHGANGVSQNIILAQKYERFALLMVR